MVMRILWRLAALLLPVWGWSAPVPRLPPSVAAPFPAAASQALAAAVAAPALAAPASLSAPRLSAAPAPASPDRPALDSLQRSVERLAAARDEGEAGRLISGRYDGPAPPLEEDAPVYGGVVAGVSPLREARLGRQSLLVAAAVEDARPALELSVRHGAWNGPGTTLDGPCCRDAAPKLAFLLRERGLPADVVEAQFHYYLLYRLPAGEIVIDPTIRQFFGAARAPSSIPRVFVGTIAELRDVFHRHAAEKTSRYDVERIYFSQAQIRNARLAELEAAMAASPDAAEYLALRPRQPGTRDQKLIVSETR